MKSSKLRTIVATVIFIVLSLGLVAGIGLGTLSGFGWDTISMLCPLGALTSMIASRALVPRALVSLAIAAIIVLLLGRVFCGWVCPVPLFSRVRAFFRSPQARKKFESERHDEIVALAQEELSRAKESEDCGSACSSCGASCSDIRKKLDSRHAILGGALLSTAIFGFPVFCLVCPIGLSFATVLVVWRVFAMGDVTVSAVLIPLVLIVEVLFLRKWCSRFCPLSALMNLVSRFNRTWRPEIDDSKCLESSRGVVCSKCAEVCDADINLRHPALGERDLSDCTRCRACVDECPTHAVSIAFISKRKNSSSSDPHEKEPAILAHDQTK